LAVDAAAFRRDRYLRSSAYHLATWSFAGCVLELRRGTGTASLHDALAAGVVVVGISLLSSFTNERRVGKIAGVAGEPVWTGAGTMWLATFAALAVVSAVAVSLRRADLLFDFWVALVGAAFAYWGSKTDFPWYGRVGLALVLSVVVDLALQANGGPVGAFRFLLLGIVLPAAAVWTNREYLWFRNS
jgi:hypothetical protein